ncbi:cytochrome d ubiquinol oxidase subunit II [Nocardia alba]|uniref:Cytochrome bd-I ubiquinol oxidase subunit 2 apoprotein n=1 Tax=Nocardia alba TaxID=225051 RepID=A0A4R1FVS3_9NOCA|nr:cytochrome d ubiquinol oxidase subunit II [Nocardia alba]TCJ96708.1 cytochrome bd-I ubiquinol oxidase subunit 2 apoprotein [Nocardia alba]
MSLQQFWFVLVAVLFTGYFILEGFDFGVGMLMPILGKGSDVRRRVVLNTIGPVWDGNEVWLITAGGAMFAAFPEWYASLFSGFYLALLLLLVALILRICAIEWRAKINSPKWRAWCDIGIGIGSWIPALAWGWVFANLVRGVPLNEKHQVVGSVWDLLSPYALLGGATTAILFALHGAIFLALKTGGEVRDDARACVRILFVPTVVIVGGFGLWTQLAYGSGWTWAALGAAVLGLVVAGGATAAARDGWAFLGTTLTIAAATILLVGSLYPNVMPSTIDPAFDLNIDNASSSRYTLQVMSWAAILCTPVVLIYQGWTYWVFRKRLTVEQIPEPTGLPLSK